MHCLVVAIAVMTVFVPAALGLDCIEPRCADGCERMNGTDDSCPHCVCQPTSCASTSCPANSACIERNGKAECFSKRFCPELKCQKNCYKEERSGKCDICRCPCRTLKCNATEACYLQEVQCFTTPCYPVAECRPKSEVCPMYKFKANCYTREMEGQCDEVVCPCETLKCNATEACYLQQVQCFTTPCYPVAECRPKSEVCPVYKLKANCYTREREGQCDEAVCSCGTLKCSRTELCTLKKVQCVKAPCYPVAECKPKLKVCPMVKVHGTCYKREIIGQCDEIVCPCHTVRCTAGTVCRLQKVACKRTPCYPQAVCAPVCPTQKPCSIRCSTPLKIDENGCQLCQCSQPPQ